MDDYEEIYESAARVARWNNPVVRARREAREEARRRIIYYGPRPSSLAWEMLHRTSNKPIDHDNQDHIEAALRIDRWLKKYSPHEFYQFMTEKEKRDWRANAGRNF